MRLQDLGRTKRGSGCRKTRFVPRVSTAEFSSGCVRGPVLSANSTFRASNRLPQTGSQNQSGFYREIDRNLEEAHASLEGNIRVSTLGQPSAPGWRQEVNRRLAEHKNRKANGSPSEVPAQPSEEGANLGSSRAAQAAARVAARFAKAPSFSQMQAEEARMAVRHAEIATQVALEAQSAAESALAGLHAASANRRAAEVVAFPADAVAPVQTPVESPLQTPLQAPFQPEPAIIPFVDSAIEPVAEQAIAPAPQPAPPQPEAPAGPVTSAKDSAGQLLQIRWEPDMPLRTAEASTAEPFELSAEDWFTAADPAQHRDEPHEIDARPIHANLIQFPRELIATRRMRPHLSEPEPQPGTQLSIFEIDPGTVQTEAPAPVPHPNYAEPEVKPAPAASAAHPAAKSLSWASPEWHGMKLGAQADAVSAAAETQTKLALAPLSRRLMAGVVDFAIVGALASFVWFTVALGRATPMTPRAAELLGVGVLALAGLAYHAFCCLLSLRTAGMRYAGISLCTLDDCVPTPQHLRRRLGAMVISTLPLGLGMVWGVFDEDHLNWHDRFSQTYLRHS